jgi:hypothetical protein
LSAVVLGGALLAGCGHAEVHEVVLRSVEEPTGHPTELYFGKRLPGRPFYEVALLQVVGNGDEADVESLSKAISERASALGCDAVVRLRVDQGVTRAHAYGVCVRYTEALPVAPWRPVTPPSKTAPPAAAPSSEEPAPTSEDAGF